MACASEWLDYALSCKSETYFMRKGFVSLAPGAPQVEVPRERLCFPDSAGSCRQLRRCGKDDKIIEKREIIFFKKREKAIDNFLQDCYNTKVVRHQMYMGV